MKRTFTITFVITLGSLLASCIDRVSADVAAAIGAPDFKVSEHPVASTFYWFSSVELGVCFGPEARAGSIKGAIHCTHQGNYDIDNNTWTLPQTCVALKPIGGPLSTAIRESCTNAKGVFNVITPAAANSDGSQAYNAIKPPGEGGDAGSGGDGDGKKKEDGGILSSMTSLFNI
ncbi:uncharacterized protein UTRI_02204_B [Ustilago trichophora]|uniref:Pep1 n=1 Tax=Ustilago trichophora TaxID=86804 RepID=A0A5C3DUN8_9BASI|nr:uncharacterized protein UTRI_02204_B [Ustilago trichophora]